MAFNNISQQYALLDGDTGSSILYGIAKQRTTSKSQFHENMQAYCALQLTDRHLSSYNLGGWNIAANEEEFT